MTTSQFNAILTQVRFIESFWFVPPRPSSSSTVPETTGKTGGVPNCIMQPSDGGITSAVRAVIVRLFLESGGGNIGLQKLRCR